MYGIFTYDGMIPGVQWTALWMRDGELVSYESYPWNGGTGGAYFTEWNLLQISGCQGYTPCSYSWVRSMY